MIRVIIVIPFATCERTSSSLSGNATGIVFKLLVEPLASERIVCVSRVKPRSAKIFLSSSFEIFSDFASFANFVHLHECAIKTFKKWLISGQEGI